MKANLLILSTALVLVLSATGCKKCAVCTNDKGEETKFCSQDKDSREGFIRTYTLLGQTCTGDF